MLCDGDSVSNATGSSQAITSIKVLAARSRADWIQPALARNVMRQSAGLEAPIRCVSGDDIVVGARHRDSRTRRSVAYHQKIRFHLRVVAVKADDDICGEVLASG